MRGKYLQRISVTHTHTKELVYHLQTLTLGRKDGNGLAEVVPQIRC